MKISLDKEHRNDFVPAVAVLSVVMMGLFCGIIYMAQKYQDKTKALKIESVQPKENKIVNMQNTLKITNFVRQR